MCSCGGTRDCSTSNVWHARAAFKGEGDVGGVAETPRAKGTYGWPCWMQGWGFNRLQCTTPTKQEEALKTQTACLVYSVRRCMPSITDPGYTGMHLPSGRWCSACQVCWAKRLWDGSMEIRLADCYLLFLA